MDDGKGKNGSVKELDKVIQVDERAIQSHLSEVVRGTVEETLNAKLDAAVFEAYGWDAGMGDEEVLERLLGVNLERAKK